MKSRWYHFKCKTRKELRRKIVNFCCISNRALVIPMSLVVNAQAVKMAVANLERAVRPDFSSVFGELLHHATAVQPFPPSGVGRLERRGHFQAFLRWLCLDLERQVADLESFLGQQDVNARTLVIRWLESHSSALVPDLAAPPERALFLSDLEIVLTLIDYAGE